MIHPDPGAILAMQWQKWSIQLAELTVAGINAAAIRKISIGVGDLDNPKPGGIGIIYVDNIRVIQSKPDEN